MLAGVANSTGQAESHEWLQDTRLISEQDGIFVRDQEKLAGKKAFAQDDYLLPMHKLVYLQQ